MREIVWHSIERELRLRQQRAYRDRIARVRRANARAVAGTGWNSVGAENQAPLIGLMARMNALQNAPSMSFATAFASRPASLRKARASSAW